MEYLDVLDEKGNAMGKVAPRVEVHATGLWHNVVHIYLFREKNNDLELLVHLRSATKDLNPNKWDTRFGGHVKAGDTIEKTVDIELEEETGLTVKKENLMKGGVVAYDGTTNRELISVYFYNFDGDAETLRFNDGEVQEVRWMSVRDISSSAEENPHQWTGGRNGFQEILTMLARARKES